MSDIAKRLKKLSAKANLSATEKELVQILATIEERLHKLEGGSPADPIESPLGMTAPQSR